VPGSLSPSLRRLALAGVVVVGLGLSGGAVAASPSGLGTQTDPVAPTTQPQAESTTAPDGVADTGVPADGAAPADDADAAKQQADDDLRAVWTVVAGLGAVALGLLVMLVIYVRATKPSRVAAGAGSEADGAEADDETPEDADAEPTRVVGATTASRPPAGPKVGPAPARKEKVGAVATAPAPFDDEAGDDAPAATVPISGAPAAPKPGARPAGGPTPVPAKPPRRPRRVEAPAKKLGTPDAERVLVRPGQAPIRVPAPTPAPADAVADPDATPTETAKDDASSRRVDGPPPPAPPTPVPPAPAPPSSGSNGDR